MLADEHGRLFSGLNGNKAPVSGYGSGSGSRTKSSSDDEEDAEGDGDENDEDHTAKLAAVTDRRLKRLSSRSDNVSALQRVKSLTQRNRMASSRSSNFIFRGINILFRSLIN